MTLEGSGIPSVRQIQETVLNSKRKEIAELLLKNGRAYFMKDGLTDQSTRALIKELSDLGYIVTKPDIFDGAFFSINTHYSKNVLGKHDTIVTGDETSI